MSGQPDTELVDAALAGDKEAFGQLVVRYQAMAVGIAMRMVANEELARDLVQDAMLHAYLSLDNLQDAGRFRNWLYGIVLNVSRNYLRAQQTSLLLEAAGGLSLDALPLASDEAAPHELVQQRELRALMMEQLNVLSPKNRAAMLLFYYDQLSLKEIAAALDISITAVKSRLHKSRKQLCARLAPLVVEKRITIPGIERRPRMIEVTAVHVVKTEATENYILMLLDQPNRRVLPIWVGPHEGIQILLHLRRFPTARPMTYQLMAGLLDTAAVHLQEVRIETLKDDVFYATVKMRNGEGVHEHDARPSDAIALALHAGIPIYIADDVMAGVGRELPEVFDEKMWQKTILDAKEMETLYSVVYPQPSDIKDEVGRFTRRAHQAWERAQEEAKRLNHNYVGTEHLLLAWVGDEVSAAAQVLREMGVERKQIEDATDLLVGRGSQSLTSEPVMVPRVTQVVRLADEERRVLGHQYIGTEHLLLGLVREGKGAAANVLRSLDMNMNQVRNQILDLMTRT